MIDIKQHAPRTTSNYEQFAKRRPTDIISAYKKDHISISQMAFTIAQLETKCLQNGLSLPYETNPFDEMFRKGE